MAETGLGSDLKNVLNGDAGSAIKSVVGRFKRSEKTLSAPEEHRKNAPQQKPHENVVTHMLRRYSDKHETLVGIDIIPGRIRVCQMEEHNGNWQLRHLAEASIDGELTLRNMRDFTDSYVEKLQKILISQNIHAKHAAVAIPVSSSVIKTITLPKMSDEELAQAHAVGGFWQNFVDLHGDISEYSVFYEVVRREENEETMDVLFVGSRLEDISLYTEIVSRAGLHPLIVDVRCFALNNMYHINHETDEANTPVVFLKFGPDENYIHIIDRGESFLYDIYISDEERATLMDHFNDAEILQRYAGQARQIIASHMAEHMREGEEPRTVKDIHVISLLPAIGTFVKKLGAILTDYAVKECNFFDHVKVPKHLTALIESQDNRSSWAVCMGLAARRWDIFDHYKAVEGVDHVNLLPGSEDEKIEKRTSIFSRIAVVPPLAVCISIAGLAFAYSIAEDRRISSELAALRSVEATFTQKDAAVKQAHSDARKLVGLQALKADISANQRPVLEAYRKISSVIPEGVWLTELSFQAPNMVLIKGNTLSDESVLGFVNTLKSDALFSVASLKNMHMNRDFSGSSTPVKAFTVQGELADLKVAVEKDTKDKKKGKNTASKKKVGE